MALFGDDMTQVTTPDGRVITVPSQLAAQFPGLQPVPLPGGGDPQWSPADTTALAAQTTPPDVTAAPVTLPSQVTAGAPTGQARGPVTNPAEVPVPGPPNTPKPMTEADLAKLGNAGAYNAEAGAVGEQRTAAKALGQAQADQATQAGNAMAAADAESARLLEQRRQAAEQQMAQLTAMTQDYQRAAKQIADTKIDRLADHPVLAAISVALGGIGAALAGHGEHNPALTTLMQSIDRKVAGQMQDIDKRRADLATQREGIGMARQQGMDRLTEMDTYRAGYIEQARRQIETIKTKSSSDIVKAQADNVIAGLDAEQAKMLGSAQQRFVQAQQHKETLAQQAQQHRESIGVQIRGQNLQQRQHDADRAERAQEKLDERAAQILAMQGKDAEKRAKEVKEQGIADPSTGDPLLTPDGEAKLAQADREEAQARKAGDPAQAQKLNQHAQLLRQSAQTNDIATARDAKDRDKVQGALDSTHVVTLLADEAIGKLEKDPSAFARQDWASLKANIANVKARYVATLGERVSVRALEAFDDVLSIDADSITSRTIDQGKAVAALKALRQDAALNADTTMKGAGIKSQWRPGLRSESEKFGGITAIESGQDALPAGATPDESTRQLTLTEQQNPARNPNINLNRNVGNQESAIDAANARKNSAGQASNYGLAPADDDRVRSLIKRSGGVSHAEYGRIVETLAQPLASDRGPLSIGVARLLRDEDPKLYADVLGQVPPMKAKEISEAIAIPAEVAKINPNPLGTLSPDVKRKLNARLRAQGSPEIP